MPTQRRRKKVTPDAQEAKLTEEIIKAFEEAGVPLTPENFQRALEGRRLYKFLTEVTDTLFFRLIEDLGTIVEEQLAAGFRGGMVKAGLGYIPPSRPAKIMETEGAKRVRAITCKSAPHTERDCNPPANLSPGRRARKNPQ